MNRSDFANPYLVALYKEHRRNPVDRPSINQLISRYALPRDPYFESELYEHLSAHGWANDPGLSTEYNDANLLISFNGKMQAERLLDSKIDPLPLFMPLEHYDLVIPATDRIVKLDHNSTGFLEIEAALSDLGKFVRENNSLEIESDERDRISRSLSSAATLWKAGQLKIIQIKVGILLAAEDAAAALVSTIKAVAASMLVDLIKSVVKSNTGIDLDDI